MGAPRTALAGASIEAPLIRMVLPMPLSPYSSMQGMRAQLGN
jgi:hypothetical protein